MVNIRLDDDVSNELSCYHDIEGEHILLVSDFNSSPILAIFDTYMGRGIKTKGAIYLHKPACFGKKVLPLITKVIEDPKEKWADYLPKKFYIGKSEIREALRSFGPEWELAYISSLDEL